MLRKEKEAEETRMKLVEGESVYVGVRRRDAQVDCWH